MSYQKCWKIVKWMMIVGIVAFLAALILDIPVLAFITPFSLCIGAFLYAKYYRCPYCGELIASIPPRKIMHCINCGKKLE